MSHFLRHISKGNWGGRKGAERRKRIGKEEKSRESEERKDQVGRAVSEGRDVDELLRVSIREIQQ